MSRQLTSGVLRRKKGKFPILVGTRIAGDNSSSSVLRPAIPSGYQNGDIAIGITRTRNTSSFIEFGQFTEIWQGNGTAVYYHICNEDTDETSFNNITRISISPSNRAAHIVYLFRNADVNSITHNSQSGETPPCVSGIEKAFHLVYLTSAKSILEINNTPAGYDNLILHRVVDGINSVIHSSVATAHKKDITTLECPSEWDLVDETFTATTSGLITIKGK